MEPLHKWMLLKQPEALLKLTMFKDMRRDIVLELNEASIQLCNGSLTIVRDLPPLVTLATPTSEPGASD